MDFSELVRLDKPCFEDFSTEYDDIPLYRRFRRCCFCPDYKYIEDFHIHIFKSHLVCPNCKQQFNSYLNVKEHVISAIKNMEYENVNPVLFCFEIHHHEILLSNNSSILDAFEKTSIEKLYLKVITGGCLICLNILIRMQPPIYCLIQMEPFGYDHCYHLLGNIYISKYDFKRLLIYDQSFLNYEINCNCKYFLTVAKLMMLLGKKIFPVLGINLTNNLFYPITDYMEIYTESKKPLKLQELCKNKIWLVKKNQISLYDYMKNLKIYTCTPILDYLIGLELKGAFKELDD
jgi:hypothetical protein